MSEEQEGGGEGVDSDGETREEAANITCCAIAAICLVAAIAFGAWECVRRSNELKQPAHEGQ